MNCIFIDSAYKTFENIVKIDLSKINKLFLAVTIINDSHYKISNKLPINNLDQSKIIVFGSSIQYPNYNKKYLDQNYIPIRSWDLQLVMRDHNVILENYNFIYTDDWTKITKLYQKDKITVGLGYYNTLEKLNKQSVGNLHRFVDIIIRVRPFHGYRTLESTYGIKYIGWTPQGYRQQYFRLDGKTVTLH